MEYDLKHIETQLKKRCQYPYQWGQKQNDLWDDYTRFIYQIKDWEELVEAMKICYAKHQLDKKMLFHYAANRWYNFWSAMAVEQIFTELKEVTPALNPKNRLIDFAINGIHFDHKTSVFPRKFPENIAYAKEHPREIISWLYKNQSQEQRKHLKNRLFIIVYDKTGAHWKMKAELSEMKSHIEKYVRNFSTEKLEIFDFEPPHKTYSDVIWILK